MPFRQLADDTPVIEFDPTLEISPFVLFRRLCAGQSPLLLDVRRAPQGCGLRGAEALPDDAWEPPAEREVVLFDDDGRSAFALAQRLRDAGFENVRALFGGLELYQFALDPAVVGADTFLEPLG